MAVEFQDYYQVLNVSKTATQQEIQKSYRKLARTYHPDINKEKGAEEKFKKITEAYEVLKNPEARKRYDMLGKSYEKGQPFTPPAGSWQNVNVDFGDLGIDPSGFSSFFEQFFTQGQRHSTSTRSSHAARPPMAEEAIIEVSLEEAMQGTEKELLIQDAHSLNARQLRVKIPPGATEGARIRLKNQGSNKSDLVLIVKLKPHNIFSVSGRDIFTKIALSPWEAVLGAKINVPSLDQSTITMTVPPGTQNGTQLRLRKKGLPSKTSLAGDLIVEIRIVIPTNLSAEEKELFEKLKAVSKFNPR
jgi:curved DNA-binding protein